MNRKLLILVSALMLLAGPVRAQSDQAGIVTIDQSKQIVSTGKPVRVAQYLAIKPGQDQVPLFLYYKNGDDKTPGFTSFTVSIAGTKVIDESQFKKDEKVLRQDMTGQIKSGNNQVLFNGIGPNGAVFSWVLTAAQANISLIQPNQVKTGDQIDIKGHNFSSKQADNIVMFEGTQADIVSIKGDTITVTVPKGLKSGDNKVTVTTKKQKSNAVTVKVKAGEPPVLSSLNYQSAYCGFTITITGQHFSPDMSKNVVKFGDLVAPVISGSETSLNVAIPQMAEPQWYVPITVTSDGLKSTNSLSINVQVRVF